MAVYTIIINEGPDEHTFESPRLQWTPRVRNEWNESNVLNKSDFLLSLKGQLRGVGADPAQDVMQKWKDVLEVAQRGTAQRVRIYRDATLEVDLNPALVVGGPFIISFDVDPTGASFANHVQFSMEISTTTVGSGEFTNNPDIVNLRREIETETFNDELERKEWRATATGDDALDLVTGFKPTDAEPLREIVTQQLDQNSATARYIFETKKDHLRVEESIVVDGGGRPIVPVLIQPTSAPAAPGGPGGLAGFNIAIDSPPKLFRGRVRPITVTVQGTITSKDQDLGIPTLHFPEENYDSTRSRFDLEIRYDPERKHFSRTYTEVYIFAEGPIPAPDHSGHPDAVTGLTEPADGNINP